MLQSPFWVWSTWLRLWLFQAWRIPHSLGALGASKMNVTPMAAGIAVPMLGYSLRHASTSMGLRRHNRPWTWVHASAAPQVDFRAARKGESPFSSSVVYWVFVFSPNVASRCKNEYQLVAVPGAAVGLSATCQNGKGTYTVQSTDLSKST